MTLNSVCAIHERRPLRRATRDTQLAVERLLFIAKFHYTGPTGPDRTRTDFFAARVSEKLRWVRAGLRQSPCGSGRVRVVEFSYYDALADEIFTA